MRAASFLVSAHHTNRTLTSQHQPTRDEREARQDGTFRDSSLPERQLWRDLHAPAKISIRLGPTRTNHRSPCVLIRRSGRAAMRLLQQSPVGRELREHQPSGASNGIGHFPNKTSAKHRTHRESAANSWARYRRLPNGCRQWQPSATFGNQTQRGNIGFMRLSARRQLSVTLRRRHRIPLGLPISPLFHKGFFAARRRPLPNLSQSA